jgi:hypothetical protein
VLLYVLLVYSRLEKGACEGLLTGLILDTPGIGVAVLFCSPGCGWVLRWFNRVLA